MGVLASTVHRTQHSTRLRNVPVASGCARDVIGMLVSYSLMGRFQLWQDCSKIMHLINEKNDKEKNCSA